jgi:hypothetical protein
MLTLTAIVPATNRPATLDRCVRAIEVSEDAPEEVIVVTDAPFPGPSAARNEGARRAAGDVLVFVDADILPHRDAFARIRRAFDQEPELAALFGSYDDTPEAPGAVSNFRNLLHHHVHQSGAGPATTFWTGLGAVRRDAYQATGGFDPGQRWLEDVDFGMRLSASGAAIVLDPKVQGTHLKRWSLAEMVRTDFGRRGIPWVELMLRHRHTAPGLNLGARHRLSALASFTAAVALVRGNPRVAGCALLALVPLNAPFYRLLLRRRGAAEATLGVGLHAVHHVTGVLSVPFGVLAYALPHKPST